VNYGDGSGVLPLFIGLDGLPVFARSYSSPGTYTVAVTVSNGLANASDSFVVTVANTAGISAAPNSSYLLTGPTGGKTLTVYGGSVTFTADVASANPNLAVSVKGGTDVRFGTSQHLASLSVLGTATVIAGGDKVLITNNLSISSGGRLDLRDNNLVLNYSSISQMGTWNGSAYTGITGMVATGRNGGSWLGSGIVTSMASGSLTTLAIAEASDVLHISGLQTALFDGLSVDATSVIVEYTYDGDFNLDGKLNIDDYVRIDSGVAGGLAGWSNGDLNFDGKINIDDFTILDRDNSSQGLLL
jgi:hypothetical protein